MNLSILGIEDFFKNQVLNNNNNNNNKTFIMNPNSYFQLYGFGQMKPHKPQCSHLHNENSNDEICLIVLCK